MTVQTFALIGYGDIVIQRGRPARRFFVTGDTGRGKYNIEEETTGRQMRIGYLGVEKVSAADLAAHPFDRKPPVELRPMQRVNVRGDVHIWVVIRYTTPQRVKLMRADGVGRGMTAPTSFVTPVE